MENAPILTPAQCRAARGLLDWGQSDLAAAAKLSTRAVSEYERGRGQPRVDTVARLAAALDAAGIDLLFDPDGVRVRGNEAMSGADTCHPPSASAV